jgi:hypothetical protein
MRRRVLEKALEEEARAAMQQLGPGAGAGDIGRWCSSSASTIAPPPAY